MYKLIYCFQRDWKRMWKVLHFLVLFFGLNVVNPSLYALDNIGKVAGQIVDAETGEGLIGANVYFEGTNMGTATDLDGTFFIRDVPSGKYILTVQMIGYAETKITDFEVVSGETRKLELALQSETFTTDEVVVEARKVMNNEASLLSSRQKAVAVSDAISAEAISRSGSGDAAEAMKKVTGASVVNGKYVYVRGLGDRYSTTQLNGAELPSSDPDKKAFQLDLLPSNLLDNIVTLKTFTPDKSGNFTGGIVDVNTKAFPDELTIKLSTSSSFNEQANYNDNFITYSGGDRDWLGFDDDTRNIPEIWKNPSPELEVLKSRPRIKARFDEEKAKLIEKATSSFNSTMDFKRESIPFNQNLSISAGNRVRFGKNSALGYLGSFTYNRTYSFYEDGEVGRYTLNEGATDLNPELVVSDSKGESEANWGALANLVFNINPSHQVGTNFFYSKSGISTARYQAGKWPHQFGPGDDTPDYFNRVLSFLERDIRSFQFNGEHYFDNIFNLTADWSVTLAQTTQDEPDRRLIASLTFLEPEVTHVIKGSNWDQPSRYFRFLEDDKNTYNLNFALPFTQWAGQKGKFKFGLHHQDIKRDFKERIFTYDLEAGLFNELGGDINALFSDEYTGITDTDTLNDGRVRYFFGNLLNENSKLKNNYDGNQTIQAVYGMLELPITRKLRFIGGLRFETTQIKVVSEDTLQDKGNVDVRDLLPSVNLIYQLKDNLNLRFAATRTLARPTFRELAPYSTKEFVNDWELVGNPNLKRTLIQNYDLRLEWFTRPGEILAISGFYKKLKNPIELAIDPNSISANLILKYANVDKASLVGTEIEARVRLDHLTRMLNNFSVGSNLSFVKSTVDIEASELAERRVVDPDYPDTRVLQGQSDYIFNLDFTYRNKIGTVASIYYNTFGERLSKVSFIITPDIFEQPVSQLDFLVSQRLFSKYSLKFALKNILNSSYKEIYRFNGKDYIAHRYEIGLTYSVGFEYNF